MNRILWLIPALCFSVLLCGCATDTDKRDGDQVEKPSKMTYFPKGKKIRR